MKYHNPHYLNRVDISNLARDLAILLHNPWDGEDTAKIPYIPEMLPKKEPEPEPAKPKLGSRRLKI